MAGRSWMACAARLCFVAVLAWPIAPASAYGQVGVAPGHQGVSIEYEVVSTGSPTLVFVHGWMCDRTYWREQRAHFSDRFGVVLLDLGGHGHSGSDRTDWSIDGFAGDVVAVLEALKLSDAILVGHSMGGPVVAEAALLAPERFRAVVGADTYQYLGAPWLRGQGVPNLVARLENDFVGTATGFVNGMFTGDFDPGLKQVVLEGMTAGSAAVGTPSTGSMFEWYRDRAVQSLNAIRQPLWTINSADYVGTDVQQLQGLVPHIHVRFLDDVGHFVMLEAPAAFNRTLDEVISGILAN